MTKIIDSKLLAMLMSTWITCCTDVGGYGGAIFSLSFHSLTLWDLNAKKATGSDTLGGNK